MFRAYVNVRPKEGVLNPQGQVILSTLRKLGYSEAAGLRVGKLLELELDVESKEEALTRVEEMCAKLLANPVMEEYEIRVEEEGS